ncbi:MFS transporter [Caballeronia sp.]|uniref:MFS transporter n=1 Tax=Caballeronia sp. TaxID=1931223 RepID=UPI003C6BC1AB
MSARTPHLTRRLTLLFALASGVIIANIYYSQPLLAGIASTFGYSPARLGVLVTLTQLGYACGLLLIVPLGDVLNRRTLIVSLLLLTVVALLAVALSPDFKLFAAASMLLGVTSCAAQLQVPFAASLASDNERGRVVGIVMSGLLLGILLARTASGTIAQLAGWRIVYGVAAFLILLLTLCLVRALPQDRRSDQPWRYRQLLQSLLTLLNQHPTIGLRSLYGALGYACFSIFWTALTFLLNAAPYHYSEARIGMFGLAGAAGALAAGSAGRMADRGHGHRATGLFSSAILVSFVFIYLGAHSLTLLLVGVLLLDVGVQGLHISNQGVIYALAPDARSRITTIYLTCYFFGGAIGSGTASVAYYEAAWSGVCVAGALFSTLLIGSWLTAHRRQRRRLCLQ